MRDKEGETRRERGLGNGRRRRGKREKSERIRREKGLAFTGSLRKWPQW